MILSFSVFFIYIIFMAVCEQVIESEASVKMQFLCLVSLLVLSFRIKSKIKLQLEWYKPWVLKPDLRGVKGTAKVSKHPS